MKHVIVTGGSRGLGAYLVENLLDSGYRVSTCSRTKTRYIEELGDNQKYAGRFFWMACDIGAAQSVADFVRSAIEQAQGDGIYGLVNNAGIAMAGILATFPTVEIEKIIGVNLLGTIQFCRLALQHILRQKGGGRIINISSIIGSRGYTGLSAYSASKAGIDGLTRALAREMGSRKITVNSVAPGYLRTEMSSTLNPGQMAQIVNRTPLGRLGEPSDVGGIVRFLLSDEAGFITGQTFLVDGGVSC